MPWGVLVAGPPGSGKSTYCAAAAELLQRHHGRPCAAVNLDFANEWPAGPGGGGGGGAGGGRHRRGHDEVAMPRRLS